MKKKYTYYLYDPSEGEKTNNLYRVDEDGNAWFYKPRRNTWILDSNEWGSLDEDEEAIEITEQKAFTILL